MLRRVLLFLAVLTSATGCNGGSNCETGSEGCVCTSGGACDPGLQCLSQRCVDPLWVPDGGSTSSLLPDGGMKPQPPPPCTSNASCAPGELCTYDSDGGSACVSGSNKPCDGGPCIRSMGYDVHEIGEESALRGRTCRTTDDCPVTRGNVLGLCVDRDGTGMNRTCVPMCQYHDDPRVLSCASDPRGGITTICSRNHARAFTTLQVAYQCTSTRLTAGQCLGTTAPFDADLEWTVDCIEDHLQAQTSSCVPIVVLGSTSCFLNADRLDAKMTGPDFTAAVRQLLSLTFSSSSGGNMSTTQACGTDCDCGRCSYCEKSGGSSACRYAGEGPYGCYRGCN